MASSIWSVIQTLVGKKKPDLQGRVRTLLSSPSSHQHDRAIVIKSVGTLLDSSCPTSTLLHRLTMFQCLVWERLNTGHWSDVWEGWRELYGLIVVSRIRGVALICEKHERDNEESLLQDVIRLCDLGIMFSGDVMGGVLEEIAQILTEFHTDQNFNKDVVDEKDSTIHESIPHKKVKLSSEFSIRSQSLPLTLPLLPVPFLSSPSLTNFLTQCKVPLTATILRDCMTDWPCMQERRWCCDYLVKMAGPRTVPVELGNKYTDHSWTQQLLTVETFVRKYMMERVGVVGYLAQHQLLDQVPSLARDILTPDYCYTGESEAEPDINVWIGPGGTVSPPHTDKKHNILCQVVGTKYVALFYPDQGDKLYPDTNPMMHNTSMVDLESPDLTKFPLMSTLQGYHTLLREGEMLYIPPMVWHYVRSLEESFSVSFWWE